MHKTDVTTFQVRFPRKSGFCQIDRKSQYWQDTCADWGRHTQGSVMLHRVEDISRKPFAEDLRANPALAADFARRKQSGEYDDDMLPMYHRLCRQR